MKVLFDTSVVVAASLPQHPSYAGERQKQMWKAANAEFQALYAVE